MTTPTDPNRNDATTAGQVTAGELASDDTSRLLKIAAPIVVGEIVSTVAKLGAIYLFDHRYHAERDDLTNKAALVLGSVRHGKNSNELTEQELLQAFDTVRFPVKWLVGEVAGSIAQWPTQIVLEKMCGTNELTEEELANRKPPTFGEVVKEVFCGKVAAFALSVGVVQAAKKVPYTHDQIEKATDWVDRTFYTSDSASRTDAKNFTELAFLDATGTAFGIVASVFTRLKMKEAAAAKAAEAPSV